VNHRHRKVLHALFSHPIPTNIHLHDVEHVMKELGAEMGHSGSGRLSVKLNGSALTVHGSDHGLSKDEVTGLRHFLQSVGIDPERDYPL
jgi:hypothetical protein